MNNATTETAARTALGIPADDRRVTVEVTRDGWADAWCAERDAPAVAYVEYGVRDEEEGGYAQTDIAWGEEIAADEIAALLARESTDPDGEIRIEVSYYWLLYRNSAAAA